MEAEKRLLKSFIEMMASAIDTKSPYTGGHCQRVPELTFMLAEAISEDKTLFPDFHLDEQSREALFFATWLHDCGKVTTPEFVVDKATKLETLYNRIHEIRTRFEVLKRDAQITYWKRRNDGEKKDNLDIWLDRELKALEDDFAFIAAANNGETPLHDDDVTRLQQIAKRCWQPSLNPRIGLSWEEEERIAQSGSHSGTGWESVLMDRPEHHIPWSAQQRKSFIDWPYTLTPPDLQYNRGELYNLSIRTGTLTAEERFIINDHIVQTIEMLSKLPYPKHLKAIPHMAGGHHERIDGKGYPLGLDANTLSLEAKIMAIADVFEALTASDRPYKRAKPLSVAMTILASMVKGGHIDAALFRLFVVKKIYLRYAAAFLPDKQIDAVDEEAILALAESDRPR